MNVLKSFFLTHSSVPLINIWELNKYILVLALEYEILKLAEDQEVSDGGMVAAKLSWSMLGPVAEACVHEKVGATIGSQFLFFGITIIKNLLSWFLVCESRQNDRKDRLLTKWS